MQHMVVYASPDGKSSYFHADDLESALRFVEHLVNEESATDSRIFELRAVPIEIKRYFKVEVNAPGNGAGEVADAETDQAGPAVEEPLTADMGDHPQPVPVPSGSPSSRFGLFSR